MATARRWRTIKPAVGTASFDEEAAYRKFRVLRDRDRALEGATTGMDLRGRAELVRALSLRASLDTASARRVVDALFSARGGIIAEALRSGEEVRISGFGTFEASRASFRPDRALAAAIAA